MLARFLLLLSHIYRAKVAGGFRAGPGSGGGGGPGVVCGVRWREPTNRGGEAYHLTDTGSSGEEWWSGVGGRVVRSSGGSASVDGNQCWWDASGLAGLLSSSHW